MCVYFINLNKACSKDSSSVSKIERLVNFMTCFKFLSSVDSNSGYHQILMHSDDKEKTSFITKEGTYCYKVMLFELNKVGAIYPCMMNKVFKL